MGADVKGYITVPPADLERGRGGMDLLDRAKPSDRIEIGIVHKDGTEERVRMPASIGTAIRDLLRTLRTSNRVAVIGESEELSPEEAGKILGISRPLVVRKMDAGKLPFRYVGAHRRCKLSDVLALKEEEERRNQALRELVEDSEDLAKNHGL
ncbi:MAG TPA: helix-turn-helix domain-containing protein [Dongiaceae bacterium]|nr:helix-turn-helix domain-containing protein [Dongiaceae bacterium]